MRGLKIIAFFLFFIVAFCKEAYCFDTMLEYEDNTRDGSLWFFNIDNCFDSGKAVFQLSVGDFNNVSIPHYLKENMSAEEASRAGWSTLVTLGRAALYMSMLMSFNVASLVALVAIGIEYIIMLDICTNAYVVAPHEYANVLLGYQCSRGGGKTKFVQGDKLMPPLTAVDVPFFYHCDPMYDPDRNGPLSENDSDYRQKLNNTYGYMGAASLYCTNEYGKLVGTSAENGGSGNNLPKGAPTNLKKLSSGHALVYHTNILYRLFGRDGSFIDVFTFLVQGFRGQHKPCTFQKGGNLYDITGTGSPKGGFSLIGYYRFNNSIGKVQFCVAAPYTLFPVKIGCTYVPPPVNLVDVPLLDIAEGTRCQYFSHGRSDLKSLGLYINKNLIESDPYGNKKSVSKFLMSDLHITSTVVGCILDLLERAFIYGGSKGGFFSNIQQNLKKIIFAALTLYLCLTGIKIMSSGDSLRRGEYVMFGVKFALVIYFTLGNAWFAIDEKGNKVGIYHGIIDGAQQIASYFMDAQNVSDPLGHCRFDFANAQLLSQRNIPAVGDMLATEGANGYIKMTVWDLIDCRIISYLNMGTCNYSFEGLIAIWAITALILVSGIGFILCIAMFIYTYMLFKIIFKFVHIFVLSMFAITILVAVSPIIITFALFEFTKGIFEQWFRMLLGYIFYPGLHFAFIALMLSTFDNIYFGGLKMDPGSPSIFEQCKELGSSESPICAIANNASADGDKGVISSSVRDMCDSNIGSIIKGLYKTTDLWILGSYTTMSLDVVEALFMTMLKLTLMAFLFFMLMNSISTFFAYLTGVESMAGMSKGDISSVFAKAFSFVATSPFKLAKKAVSGKKSNADSSGGGSENNVPRR